MPNDVSLIRDPNSLDFSFVPSSLPARESELEILRNIIVEPLRNGVSSTIIIYGPSGTGKTVTAKYLMRSDPKITTIYENALSFGNLKTLLVDVLLKIGKIVPNKGISYPNIFRLLKSQIQGTGGKMLIVVDEASGIMKKDPDGFYNLIRAEELYGAKLSCILISIDDPTLYLTGKHRLAFGVFSSIKFKPYSQRELELIVRDRARIALRSGSYPDTIISEISLIASRFGSARVAIELLQKSAYMAQSTGSDAISSEDVRSAQALINPYITESKLSDLNTDELIVLMAICRNLFDSPETDIPGTYRTAMMITETHDHDPIDIQKIYRVVSKLESVGIIDARISGRGDSRGVGKYIFISDIPVKVLFDKIEEMISRSG
ncbi:MAG: AAA family ATPase [Thermoplasmataceae archaeon]